MNFKDKIKELKPTDLNCNVFDVYNYNGLSMQELLCQFFTKINECVNLTNESNDLIEYLVNEGLSYEVSKKLVEWLNDGTLSEVINSSLFSGLLSKIENVENNVNNMKNSQHHYLIDVPQQSDLKSKFINGAKMYFDNRLINYDSLINNYYNVLQSQNSSYMTKEIIGKSQNDIYDIYCYKLKPRVPRYKVVIVSGVHGSEYVYPSTLFNFIELLCKNDIHKYSYLQEIRENIEFTIIPIVNPHGYNNNNRTNINDVDINRNFNYKWDEETSSHKGNNPFSENETNIIKTVVERESPNLFIDLHNTHELEYDFYSTYDSNKKNAFIVRQLLDMMNQVKINEKGNSKGILLDGTSSKPTAQAYFNKVLNIPSYTIEWVNSAYNEDNSNWYNSKDITKALQILVNIIYRNFEYYKESQEVEQVEIHQINMLGSSTLSYQNISSYSKINKFEHKIIAPYNCVVKFNGSITLLNSSNSNVNVFSSLNKTGEITNNEEFTNEVYTDYAGRSVLPIYSSYNFNEGDEINLNVFIKASASKATVFRYRGLLEIIPNATRKLVTKQ